MFSFFYRRTASAAVTLALAAIAIFLIVRLIPGDPVMIMLGEGAGGDPAVVMRVRQEMGLDKPLPMQFFFWLERLLHGDLGVSIRSGEPVLSEVLRRIPRSLELIGAGLMISVILGLPLGIISARNRGNLLGGLTSFIATIGFSAPVFVTGVLLVLVFGVWLQILPPSGFVPFAEDPWLHLSCLVMPALAIGLNFMGVVSRVARASLVDILHKDYVALARSKGLTRSQALNRHALPNALVPVISIVGIRAGSLLGGAVIIEALFDWPGLSSLLVSASFARDYPLMQGSLLAIFAIFILISLLIDLTQSIFDPRLRAA
ncbi:ABC transporter permease [Brucella gallinifaecis]|uniref:ABC transporter permease n=1 Tax=Brucella gallinifaecis TaxID=215590 RepID=A0A502BNP2_9HYPH|nr:ABC transporter permease [Brucella gallinifaecis]TPF75379.1 ABC transporter permease [Brucella gallinifaecis]